MAMFGQDKDDDRGAPKKGGSVFTQSMGPLPVWGWAIVGVAGIFVYRLMVAPKKGAGAEGEGGAAELAKSMYPYPTGGVGGVFLIPSGGAQLPGGADPEPAPVVDRFSEYAKAMSARIATYGAAPPGGDAGGYAFLAATRAAAESGHPHVVPGGPGGAAVLNPTTGQRIPVAIWHGFTETQRQELQTGTPSAWAKL